MSKLPLIDKDKVFTEIDSPDALYMSREMSEWLEEVLDILNHWIKYGKTKQQHDIDELAKLIMAINKEHKG
jgi:hypothetical protein